MKKKPRKLYIWYANKNISKKIIIKRTKRRKTRRNRHKRKISDFYLFVPIVLKMNPFLNLLIINNKKIKIIIIDTSIDNKHKSSSYKDNFSTRSGIENIFSISEEKLRNYRRRDFEYRIFQELINLESKRTIPSHL